jgi:hypothetical protein
MTISGMPPTRPSENMKLGRSIHAKAGTALLSSS